MEEELVARVGRLVQTGNHTRQHAWLDGDYILADNWGQVHGRTSFEVDGDPVDRLLYRIHIL